MLVRRGDEKSNHITQQQTKSREINNSTSKRHKYRKTNNRSVENVNKIVRYKRTSQEYDYNENIY